MFQPLLTDVRTKEHLLKFSFELRSLAQIRYPQKEILNFSDAYINYYTKPTNGKSI